MGLNDFLNYTKRRTLPLWRAGRLSESDSLSYIIPWGYNLISLNGSISRYVSYFSSASGVALQNSGNSENYSLRFDRTLWRDAITRWGFYSSLSTKNSESYLEETLLAAASRKLSVWDIGGSVNTMFLGGLFSVDVGMSQGVKSFDALKDHENIIDSDPHAQFRKWNFNGNYVRQFNINEQGFDFSSQWSSQYSEDVLYGSEQMMIGSLYSVRGFTRNSISGDHGFNIRNEVGMRRPFDILGVKGSVRPWLALDYGRVWSRNEGVPEGALTGAAIGAQVNLQHGVNFEIFATKPLKKPAYLNFDPSQIWLRLGFVL